MDMDANSWFSFYFGLNAQAPLTLEQAIQIVIISNEDIDNVWHEDHTIDGRGLWKWYVFHYFPSPNPQLINSYDVVMR